MQLHMEYARLTNQFFTACHQQFKCFDHECQMFIAHSVFKQTVLNVSSAQHLQHHTIKICNKMIQLPYQRTREADHSVSSTKRSCSRHYVGQLWHVSLIVFQHSPSHMIIYWHIHMAHFLLFFTLELQFSYWFTYKTLLLS